MKLQSILNKRNRALLRELVVTDFKLRYQGSILGYLWSLLRPLFLFAIMYIVFGKFLKIGSSVPHYPIYLLLGIVLWGFFTEATSQGLSAIVARGDLIRKVNFPKYIIVLSGTLSALINLFLNLLIVAFFMVINKVDIHHGIVLFPLVLIELYAIALAVAFFLSAAFVKYRDISHIWEIFLQAAFYATPILYPITLVLSANKTAAQLLMLNPVAQLIQDARYTLVSHQTVTLYNLVHNPWARAIPFVIVIVMVAVAVLYFRRNSKYFAEDV
ncbi:MAG TPA: ABC transporter permease [Candidatus Saccharimonadales bacterium]|nr:ABC transporter permease [Candidatus Saccharimonadales bacterium]